MKIQDFLIFYFLLLTPYYLLANSGNTPNASEIVKNVQRNYDATNDAVVHFTQTTMLPFSKLTKTTKGIFYLKKGSKYKIETGENTLVTDGKTTWTYMPATRQVVIDNYRDDKNTINPDKFLLDVPSNYYVVLLNAEQTNKDTAYTLRLTPKSDNSFIRSIKIVVTGNWTIRSADVSDMNDNRYIYTVNDLKINTGLPNSDFEFVPPNGTQVVDLRQR